MLTRILLYVSLLMALSQAGGFKNQQQGIQLSADISFDMCQCGYNHPPIISFYNGSIHHWKNQSFTFNQHRFVKCYPSSDQINGNLRYVAIFNTNLTVQEHQHILYINKRDHLQGLAWKPTNETSKIEQVQISEQRMVFVLKNGVHRSIQVYRLPDLALVHHTSMQNTDQYYDSIVFLDLLNNLVVYSKFHKLLKVQYGENLQKQEVLNLTGIAGYLFMAAHNLNPYTTFPVTSKFVFDYIDNTPHSSMVSITIQISEFKSSDNYTKQQGGLKVQVIRRQSYQQSQHKLYCYDRKFVFNYDRKCILQNNQCIIDQVPVYGAICSRDYQNTVNGTNRVKFTMVFASSDGSTKYIKVYEEQKERNYFIYIILSIVLFTIVTMIVITGLKKKWIKCPSKGKMSPVNEEHLGQYRKIQNN